MKTTIILLTALVISSGYFINNVSAEVSENQTFLLKGSGFAVTEDDIKISNIDLELTSQDKSGSSIDFVTKNGLVTSDDDEFVISDLEGQFLRDGRYIRLNGNIQNSLGLDTTISFFGRLIDESKDAAVYGFTGRIKTPDESYKIIYTTKLSVLSTVESNNLTIHIINGASSQGVADSYIGNIDPTGFRYFSDDRISVEPKTTITVVNDDAVSHNIISGKENYGDRRNPFTPDGRISTGPIESKNSTTITFNDPGFYRLYDPDYPWMKIVAYVFPNSENLILGQGQNQRN